MEDTVHSQLVCVSVFAACVCRGGGVHVTTHRVFFFYIYFFGCTGSQYPLCIVSQQLSFMPFLGFGTQLISCQTGQRFLREESLCSPP